MKPRVTKDSVPHQPIPLIPRKSHRFPNCASHLVSPLDTYQELLNDIEGLVRCHRDAINAEERIFCPLEELRRAAALKVENLKDEGR